MTEKNGKKILPAARVPAALPIIPLFDVVLFPKMVLPLVVMQKESIRLIDEVMAKDRLVGAVMSRNKQPKNHYSLDDLQNVGTSAVILKMAKMDENTAQILLQGISRFRLVKLLSDEPYVRADIETINPREPEGKEITAMMSSLVNQYKRVVELSTSLPPEMGAMAGTIEEPGILADMVASTIGADTVEKQAILECFDVRKRLREVMRLVAYQIEILEIGSKIQTQVKGDMDRQQREYYLRQQLKAIKDELGEKEAPNVELEELSKKIKSKELPEAAEKEAGRELDRLARMHPSSSEYTVAMTYLDWIVELPWNDASKDRLDLEKARSVLDRDHYGLEQAKKRILEYLAVLKLKPDVTGPILCLAGPPGTGKTSLGASIAKALGRKFVRVALGGIRDEAEIRGHRRTYVGALPGRIIQGIRRAGTKNPVFMLDEIDKLGADYRGDPSAALLEVLDPEQNSLFTDHYLDVAFDLSKVMFITTANRLDTIPPPLLDRMEVLRLSGYTLEEKIKIAVRYLVPRQRSAHGLTARQISISQGAIKMIISAYTHEAGVRNLEREIAGVCRGAASKIVNNEAESIKVRKTDIPDFLGPPKFSSDEIKKRVSTPGVVMGLAWTPAGGDVLFIEATIMKGSGRLILTGQLGDVMKESARAALSYIRSNAKSLGIDEQRFSKTDIHVHVPAGAIPKDGPSAGVTMLTALASIFTDRPASKNLAMTGEITLRGRVLAVGGIKEKILAAHRAGIKTLILPEQNEKDLSEVPENVREKMAFHFTANMRDVIRIALGR